MQHLLLLIILMDSEQLIMAVQEEARIMAEVIAVEIMQCLREETME